MIRVFGVFRGATTERTEYTDKTETEASRKRNARDVQIFSAVADDTSETLS